MSKQKTFSKEIKFEVFKRDKFTCQNCGSKAPEVILLIDQVKPISKGGSNDLSNLKTSCQNCDLGKRNQKLDDCSALLSQQNELMTEWKKSLENSEAKKIDTISDYWDSKISGYSLTESGRNTLSSFLKKFDLNKILEAIDIATEKYLKYDSSGEKYTQKSVDNAFDKIGGILNL